MAPARDFRPFEGIKVLDLTHALAGPFATQMLVDLGADVVKLENPDHLDYGRLVPPFVGDKSHYFLAIHHGKRSVAADLRSDEGRQLAQELAAQADVVIENFRPGVAARMGLDYKLLAERNPRLIQCSISGFGQEGSHVGLPVYDAVIQALSGFMSVTGEPDGAPLRCGVSLGDIVAGLYAAQAISAALFEREVTGRGRALDVPMLDSMVSLLTYYITLVQTSGEIPRATGSAHATIVPLSNFRTQDAWIIIAATTEGFWRNLCRALGREDMITDPRFAMLADRQIHRETLMAELNAIIATKTSAEWTEILNAFDVPNGQVNNVAQVLHSDIAAERQMFRPVATAEGTVQVCRYPVTDRDFGRGPLAPDSAPAMGEHTEEVLRQWLGRAA